MDPLKILKIEALYALLKDTPEYNLRCMQRWYSREFSTALYMVEEMDIEHVALHWYECEYQKMTPEEREDELRKLTETDTEYMDRLRREETDRGSDDEFLQQTIAEAKKATAAAKNLVNALSNQEESEPIIPVPVMGTSKLATFQDTSQVPPALPEGIQMDFTSPDANEDWDLFGPQEDD